MLGSSLLDFKQRIVASKLIERFILRACFRHRAQFILASLLTDRVIVFQGQPAVSAIATPSQTLLSGIGSWRHSRSHLEETFKAQGCQRPGTEGALNDGN